MFTKEPATSANTKEFVNQHRPVDIDPVNPNYQTETIRFRDFPMTTDHNPQIKTEFHLITDKDCQTVAKEMITNGQKTMILNAANAYHIGGGFEDNYGTQEESLFFTSDLYTRLYPLGKKINKGKDNGRYFYTTPLSHKDNEKEVNAYYTNNVWFFRHGENEADTLKHIYTPCDSFFADVFTIAGYDLRDRSKTHHYERDLFENLLNKFDWEAFKKGQKAKYRLFFEVALQKKCHSIVAVPLSCGAFAHSSQKNLTYKYVAEAFVEVSNEYKGHFENISIVAINPTVAKAFEKAYLLNNPISKEISDNNDHNNMRASIALMMGALFFGSVGIIGLIVGSLALYGIITMICTPIAAALVIGGGVSACIGLAFCFFKRLGPTPETTKHQNLPLLSLDSEHSESTVEFSAR